MADYNEIYRAYREFKVIVDEILDDIFGEGYDLIALSEYGHEFEV